MSDEAHLSTEQSRPCTSSRLSSAYVDTGRSQCDSRSSRARSEKAFSLVPIRRRADFLLANKGKRSPMPGFVLLARDRQDSDPAIRLGITVTKKIGNAVIRNRMKRRFRALGKQIIAPGGQTGFDYIIIGRDSGVERDFTLLQSELSKALAKIGK
jgi:ribonuclease P protein component